MKVREVLLILSKIDPELDVAIEQVFKEHRSIMLRSIEVLNGCVTLKDYTVRTSNRSEFVAFNGKTFEIPHTWERMLKK